MVEASSIVSLKNGGPEIDDDVRMQLKAIENARMKTLESKGSISDDSSEDESSSEEEENTKPTKYYDYN